MHIQLSIQLSLIAQRIHPRFLIIMKSTIQQFYHFYRLCLVIAIGFLWAFSGGIAQAQTVSSSDSLALVNLYNTTGGATWALNGNWLVGPVATWDGVVLNATSTNIGELDLSNNNLSGTLPNLNLPQLQSLTLSGNNLSGQVPDFSGLPQLRYLDLSYNNFSGIIPNFALPQLLALSLDGNSLTTLPNFSNLPFLRTLSVEGNQLGAGTFALPSLSGCPLLQSLLLSGNGLSGNVPDFGLPALNVLRMSDNQLSGTLPTFGGTPNVQILELTNNQLTGTIPDFDLGQLTVLSLDYNSLSGSLPSFSNMPNLTTLLLSGNDLSGIVPDFTGFGSLTVLYLDDNAFTFAGMEANAVYFGGIGGIMVYEPQAEIATTVTDNVLLSVDAGGTMSNNTYAWYVVGTSTPASIIGGNNLFTPGASGTYYCQITNSQATDLTLYSAPATLTVCGATINVTNSSCAGIDNGGLTAIPSGGTPPYTFLWDNGSTTASINNLSAGTYTVTISSTGGCLSTAAATVTNLSNPDFSLTQTATAFCNPQADALTFPMFVQSGISGTYSVTASTSLESVTVNVAANTSFNVNLSSSTPADEAINFVVENIAGCSKDTTIINIICCRIMQEGALVVVGPIDKAISPPSPVTLQSGCTFKFVVTDNTGIVKAVLTPDSGQLIKTSTIVKHFTSLSAPQGQYRIYGYKQCPSATPIVPGDTIDCPDPLPFYYRKAGLLVRLASMNTQLYSSNLLPSNQPFNAAPWNYAGTESVSSAANFTANTVDWLLLELRDSLNNNIIVSRKAALLLKNGTVVDVTAGGTMSSSSGVHFITFTPTEHHYLAVRHRNHLAVMSVTQVPLDGFSNYNYTIGNSILGGISQLYDIGDGTYSLRPGDIDANGVINRADYNIYAIQGVLNTVYNKADTNLDGNVGNGDFDLWRSNAFAIGIPLLRY